jgi:5-methylcytosine-specific restriction endonuclease McrA
MIGPRFSASSTRVTALWMPRSGSGSRIPPGSRRSNGRPLFAGERPFTDRRRRYDWAAVQAYYDEGHLYKECLSRFGFAANSWTDAVRRGELQARARALPVDRMIARSMARGSIKRRLLELGILTPVCSGCGLTEWRGKPLTIHLDHIDGNKQDSRIENLRMLCPNCHSQTPTFAGRNVHRTRRAKGSAACSISMIGRKFSAFTIAETVIGRAVNNSVLRPLLGQKPSEGALSCRGRQGAR